MVPSGSVEPAPLKLTVSGATPEAGEAETWATGGWLPVPAGMTKRVTLWAGSESLRVPLATPTDVGPLIALDVSRQNWALGLAAKFDRLMVTGVEPDKYLLMTISVRAPSDDRWAAKAATLSGLGPVAATEVSPKADL